MSRILRVGDLLVELLAKIDELAVSEMFTKLDSSSGEDIYSQVPLAAYMYQVPEEYLGDDKPEPFPFLVAYKMKGQESMSSGKIIIRLAYGLWNEDAVAGEQDVERVIEIILGLVENQDFTGWSLDEEITYAGGDQDGIQPHPEYFGYVDLPFMRESSFNIT